MAFMVGEREVRPLVADEVLRMEELGILGEEARVELLDGALVEMSPKSTRHELVKIVLNEWLTAHAASGGFRVGVEVPMLVPDRTGLPEPDLSVRPGRGRLDYATTPPLVIEIAVTSGRTDTGVKLALYAEAGVPEYWIVEPERRRVRVYDLPVGTAYERCRVLEGDAVLEPRFVPVPPLALRTLFEEL